MEGTTKDEPRINPAPAVSETASDEELEKKYGNIYRIGMTVFEDDDNEVELVYRFKRPSVASYDRYVKTLSQIGASKVSNGEDWIVREGSDTEDDESCRTRTLRSWSELAQRAIEDSFINTAESVPGVLFAQADCQHPRGQGTIDVIVTGTAGEASEGLLELVREAVGQIAGPYDDILVRSSITVAQDISVRVVVTGGSTDEEIEDRVQAILTELLAVRRGRRFYELTLSDINHAIRSNCSEAVNVKIVTPAQDITLSRDKVIILGAVSVEVERG